MGQVILPGSNKADGKRRVWMPPGATKALMGDTISVCDIPVHFDHDAGELRKCGARFVKGQERLAERHHAECAVEHADVIERFIRTRRPAIMDPQDVEYAKWLTDNKRLIAEGRVKW